MSTPTVQTQLVKTDNPYPGIRPFEEEDAERFFGRDEEIEQLLNLISTHRFVTVLGVSGSGKSSLVRAGVIPLVKMGMAANLGGNWRVVTTTPGGSPLANLDRALCKNLQAPASLLGDKPLTSFGLVEFAQLAMSPGENLLVLVDQFEELFQFRRESLAQDGGNESALFVNLLLNASGQRDVPVYVALAMRSDYLGESAQFRGLPEAMNEGHYLLPRLTRHQQQEAIEHPLEGSGVTMHPALVQRLLNDSADEPDHLPVLQHLLRRLWEEHERLKTSTIGFDEYGDSGGWKDAMNCDAEGVCRSFTQPVVEGGIRLLFQWITDQGSSAQPVRRPARFATLPEATKLEPERLRKIIEAFQARGLLRGTGEELRPDSRIDLPHESVAWQWQRLRNWIGEEARSVSRLRFIRESKEKGMPLTGLALDEALELKQRMIDFPLWRERYAGDEADEISAWIDSSRRLERRRRWRGRAAIGAVTAGILIAALLFLFLSQSQKRTTEARELAGWAGANLNEDPQLSLILGLHAWNKTKTMVPGLAQVLHDANLLDSVAVLTLRGHQNEVNNVAWSPDGRKLATASSDKTAKVWDAETGRNLLTLLGHEEYVNDIAWSPDGRKLATASDDGTARIWDSESGSKLLTLTGHDGRVIGVTWSPDGTKVATASWDNTAMVWDAADGRRLLTLRGHEWEEWVLAIDWSPDGRRLATGTAYGHVTIWDATTGRISKTFSAHLAGINGIAWSRDGRNLAMASDDRTVSIWDSASGLKLKTLSGHNGGVNNIKWSPDGSMLATASSDTTAKVWDVKTGLVLQTLPGISGAETGVSWSPDGSRIATSSSDATVKVWNSRLNIGLELLTVNEVLGIRTEAWSPDGSKLATGGKALTLNVWDVGTGNLLWHKALPDWVNDVAWSPDGTRLATACGSATEGAAVWDAVTGKLQLPLYEQKKGLWAIAWSPDGKRLATAGADNSARIWDAQTGKQLRMLRGHQSDVINIAWSSDGRLATVSRDKTAKIWDANTGKELQTFRGHQGEVSGLSWSPDGKRVVTTGADETARIWDPRTGQELRTMHGHHGIVRSASWSPNGAQIATGSSDGTAKVWDATNGQDLLTLHGHISVVTSVAWSPNGKRLATSGDDGIVQIYPYDDIELLRLVHSRIARSLSEYECQRYFNTGACPPLPETP